MATKITKTQLKQMIKKAVLKEQFFDKDGNDLRKHSRSSDSPLNLDYDKIAHETAKVAYNHLKSGGAGDHVAQQVFYAIKDLVKDQLYKDDYGMNY